MKGFCEDTQIMTAYYDRTANYRTSKNAAMIDFYFKTVSSTDVGPPLLLQVNVGV